MFALSLLFLLLLAALIVIWVDVPRVESAADAAALIGVNGDAVGDESAETEINRAARRLGTRLLAVAFLIWPVFWIECGWKWIRRGRSKLCRWRTVAELMGAVCPPLRMAQPNDWMDGKVWLPGLGWQPPGRHLQRTLERAFSKPMLFIALSILPVLIVEFGFRRLVEQHFWLQLTLHICTGLIWCAFALEFILMVSVTHRKWAYVRRNWIDLAIILLPLISFLRSLRMIRVVKLAQYAKIQQLAQMTRIYRLRGLFAKTLRALFLFEFANRVMRITPEKKLRRLQAEYQEREEELRELLAEIHKIEALIEQRTLLTARDVGDFDAEGHSIRTQNASE
jgi:voltage-gated potassium channel